jgi:cytochrome P450
MPDETLTVSVKRFTHVTRVRGKTAANRLLFSWLSDDRMREQLYSDMIDKKIALEFESRALLDDRRQSGATDGCKTQWYDEDRPKTYRQTAYLVVHPDHVESAYKQASTGAIGEEQWSHTPYNGLGGTFMLALDEPVCPAGGVVDPFRSHDKQRDYCYTLLKNLTGAFDAVATVAFKSGALLPLKTREFDVAELAEMVAVNYVARLFGFSQADLPMLKQSAQKIGNGLMYVNVGQHFVSDPTALPQAKLALAALSHRAAELIDLYDQPVGRDQEDLWEDMKEEIQNLQDYLFETPAGITARKQPLLKHFKPMMQHMADDHSPFSTTEKAIMVAGLVSGTITNLRAAVCIAIKQFFQLGPDGLEVVRKKAVDAWLVHRDASWAGTEADAFRALVEEALRVNPPPPFVPRRAATDIKLAPWSKAEQIIPKNSLIVIAVGGGSWGTSRPTAGDLAASGASRFNMEAAASSSVASGTTISSATSASACPFSKAFGGPPEPLQGDRAEYLHSCIGKDMAMYSIAYTVRQLMLLPGLTQTLDDKTQRDGTAFLDKPGPKGLTKRAGFICERYPLEYAREKLLRQAPLQTVLPVKNPVPEHAAALRQVLQFGAPFIEKVIRDARHVHFASFTFLDNDSKLVLSTVYDGDFDSYIGHFAREFGPLFDRFFSHIENGPPSPIAQHAFEFVQFLRRFNQPPVGGLFFSAYPETQVDQITWEFNKNRLYDFFTLEGGK